VATDDGLEATYLAANLRNQPPQQVPVEPTPRPSAADRLRELERLRVEGLITQEEYDARRRVVLDDL
jgi:hypothetical protein